MTQQLRDALVSALLWIEQADGPLKAQKRQAVIDFALAALAAPAPTQGTQEPEKWQPESDFHAMMAVHSLCPHGLSHPAKMRWMAAEFRKRTIAAPAPSASPASIAVTENMVSRFLGWRVPDDFSPDCGISFAPNRYKGEIFSWPIGTNLLSAVQARQMLEHVLAEPSASPALYTMDQMRDYADAYHRARVSALPAALTGDDHE